MKGIVDKLFGWTGMTGNEETGMEVVNLEEETMVFNPDEIKNAIEQKNEQDSKKLFGNRKTSTATMMSSAKALVVVIEPTTFEDAQMAVDHLKNKRPVILNLEQCTKEIGIRIIDFISGATYAINGTMQKIGQGIFIFAPEWIDIFGSKINRENVQ